MKLFISTAIIFFMTLMLEGCLIDGEERHYLYLTIYPFDMEKTYGLYILDDEGIVMKANVPITISDEGKAVIRDWTHINKDGNVYFLYTPYITEPEGPVRGDTIDTRDPLDFFTCLRIRENLQVARGKAGQCGTHIEYFYMTNAE